MLGSLIVRLSVTELTVDDGDSEDEPDGDADADADADGVPGVIGVVVRSTPTEEKPASAVPAVGDQAVVVEDLGADFLLVRSLLPSVHARLRDGPPVVVVAALLAPNSLASVSSFSSLASILSSSSRCSFVAAASPVGKLFLRLWEVAR